jgi:hypothetical protein
MEFVVTKGKKKTLTVKPEEMISITLVDLIEEKTDTKVKPQDIISFDGKKVIYTDGESTTVDIPDSDLIKTSAEAWIKKKFKIRGTVDIQVKKQTGGARKK